MQTKEGEGGGGREVIEEVVRPALRAFNQILL